ncbi:hypothetical protein FOA52_004283 [Chlamydomonas sp. UWO 241]|nr:hypothetical protein FOA52_004283 [Chlamydomonas sp. UWO 241]
MQFVLRTQLGSGVRMQAARPACRVFQPVQAVATSSKAKTQARHKRLRRTLSGDAERPRLAVYRSNEHIYCQIIDDTKGHTLCQASTILKDIKLELVEGNGSTQEAAKVVGKKIAEMCKAAGIEKVAFDRGGVKYHGRVKALADAAREGGLDF